MRRRSIHRCPVLMLAAALAVFLPIASGCDGAGADESDFQFLTGAWRIGTFKIDGSSYEALLEAQYGNGVIFVFSKGETGFRQFQLNGYTETGEDKLRIEGRVDIDGEENSLFLLAGAYGQVGVLMRYEIEASNRVQLTAHDRSAEVFVENLVDLDVPPDSRLTITIIQNIEQTGRSLRGE